MEEACIKCENKPNGLQVMMSRPGTRNRVLGQTSICFGKLDLLNLVLLLLGTSSAGGDRDTWWDRWTSGPCPICNKTPQPTGVCSLDIVFVKKQGTMKCRSVSTRGFLVLKRPLRRTRCDDEALKKFQWWEGHGSSRSS